MKRKPINVALLLEIRSEIEGGALKHICKNCGDIIEENDAISITHEELEELQNKGADFYTISLQDRDRKTQICEKCLNALRGDK